LLARAGRCLIRNVTEYLEAHECRETANKPETSWWKNSASVTRGREQSGEEPDTQRVQGGIRLPPKTCHPALESAYANGGTSRHLPNGYTGKLHRTVISRCAEHASIKTSDGQTENNASAVNAAERIVANQSRSRIFEVKALIHSLDAPCPTMSVPALVTTESWVQSRSMVSRS
jgi:hypothetical protein